MSKDRQDIICDKLNDIHKQIARTCSSLTPARQPAEITIVAVSKRLPAAYIAAAWQVGIRDFGENYVQEAAAKRTALPNLTDCTWHLIGPLQSNKTAQAATLFTWIHSLDQVKIARRLGAARQTHNQPAIQACVQVNLGNENTKAGIDPAKLPEFLTAIHGIDGLTVRGLMCIPEPNLDKTKQQDRFIELARLLDKSRLNHPTMDTLSMGMSADYPIAIAAGATIVRLGTALFGPRP